MVPVVVPVVVVLPVVVPPPRDPPPPLPTELLVGVGLLSLQALLPGRHSSPPTPATRSQLVPAQTCLQDAELVVQGEGVVGVGPLVAVGGVLQNPPLHQPLLHWELQVQEAPAGLF